VATEPSARRGRGALAWARSHLAIVAGTAAALVVVVVVLVVVLSSSGGSGPAVVPGAYVQSGPLTSGYRVTGRVKARSAAAVTVTITTIDFAAPEARNVALVPGLVVEFDRPAQGLVNVARNGHRVSGPSALHPGDKVTLVGQFTTVAVPPGPPHDGYAFFGIEASK
jgi:hypothetical protein